MWGHPWSVLRLEGAVQGGWRCPRNKLPLPGGLCGQRVLQRGDIPAPAGSQGKLFPAVCEVLISPHT